MTEQKPFGAGFPLLLSPHMSSPRSGRTSSHSGLPLSSYNVFLLFWTPLVPWQLISSESFQLYDLLTEG